MAFNPYNNGSRGKRASSAANEKIPDNERHHPREASGYLARSSQERHRLSWQQYQKGLATDVDLGGEKRSLSSFGSSAGMPYQSENPATLEPISRKIAPLASTSMDTFSCLKLASQVTPQPSTNVSADETSHRFPLPLLANAKADVPSRTVNRGYETLGASKRPNLHSEAISLAWVQSPGSNDMSCNGNHSYATSSSSVDHGIELESISDNDYCESYLEEDESTYMQDLASIATDPNVIAIGILAEAPPQDTHAQQKLPNISQGVVRDLTAKENNSMTQRQEEVILERPLSSARKTEHGAKRGARFSSLMRNLEPQSLGDSLQPIAHREPCELPVDLPPVRPSSSRSMDCADGQELQITPRMRGRKSAYSERQQKVKTARANMTRRELPPKSHSINSTSPPNLPIRRKSGDLTSCSDVSVNAETECGEVATLPSSACSVVTNSSGIDLDEKTRNLIILRSSSMHMARRQRSLLATDEKATTSSGSLISTTSTASQAEDAKGVARTLSASTSSSHSQRSRRSDKSAYRRGSHAARREKVKQSLSLGTEDYEYHGQDESNDALPFGPIVTSDILESDEVAPEYFTDFEAQAGVPVVLPGAFAVRPINANGQLGHPSSGYDSDFEDNTVASVENAPQANVQPPSEAHQEDATSFRPVTSSAPVQAELYHVDYAEAEVVDVAAYSKKAIKKRMRCVLAFMGLFFLVATTGIAIGILYSGEKDEVNCNEGCVPTIRGWKQVGDLLMGPTHSDSIQFGYSVAMSGDGDRVAIGLPGLDWRDGDKDIVSQAGSVFILDYNGTDWTLVAELSGLEAGGNAGTTVAISQDGKRVAFGAPNTPSGGYVAIYQQELDGMWQLVGDLLGGLLNGTTAFGTSLSFSADGLVIAVGDKYADSRGSLNKTGAVRLYQQVDLSWKQLGQDIQGQAVDELFGWSVALSQDGKRVAASAVGADSLKGTVRIFDFQDDTWVQTGSSLSGDTDRETFGAALALGKNGGILAIGATGYSQKGSGVGRVRTYEYDDISRDWKLMSDPIDGDEQFDRFGSAVALSVGGDIMAIGSPENDDFGMNSGFIRILRYDGSKWIPVGSKLGRQDGKGGLFGSSIAMSTDGKKIVGGAPELTYDGKLSKVGRVWAYEREDTDG